MSRKEIYSDNRLIVQCQAQTAWYQPDYSHIQQTQGIQSGREQQKELGVAVNHFIPRSVS